MVKSNGDNLYIAMANACITTKELAEKSGVCANTIYRMGKSYLVRPAYVGKVAKALGIDARELITVKNEKRQDELISKE